MEITVKTPNGDQHVNTVPDIQKKTEPAPLRRVSLVDLDGALGQFLAEALPYLAPNAFNVGNWKGKLSTFITSKTSSFICCGRCVGLAYLSQDPMTGQNEAKGMFLLAAEGGTEDEIVTILRCQKQWARDLGAAFIPPPKEFSSLSQSKMQVAIKAEQRTELYVPPLAKK